MCDLGPGDWVECIKAPADTPESLLIKGDGVPEWGRVYQVSACGVWHGLDWIMCGGMAHPGEIAPEWRRVPGWDARGFRTIYRPKSSLIETLKQPAPDAVRELVDA